MSVLVIDMQTKDDNIFQSRVYDGLKDVFVMRNPDRSDFNNAFKDIKPWDLVILMGHGDRFGLYNKDWTGYIVDAHNVHHLKDVDVIGFWCYAAEFADLNGLHGFFTSMFISNFSEAEMMGFPDTVPSTVDTENVRFADSLRKLLVDGVPLSEFPIRLQELCNRNLPFVRFNYEGLCTL